jgi:two-component system cell cycle sensor histidine kinase/response regulator CckA
VREAADGVEAFEAIREAGATPDLIVSDVVMPRMGGLELAEKVRALAPATRFLFVSGYTENALRDGLERGPGVGFIAKPFGLDALARRVRELLDERDGGVR